MKKYIEPAVKRVEMQHFCDGGVMPEISVYNQEGDEGGFAEENGTFEDESDAYSKNLRHLNVWEK
jgi:hypothetical protein